MRRKKQLGPGRKPTHKFGPLNDALGVGIPERMKNKLRRLARKKGTSMTALVLQWIDDYR